MKRNNKGFTLIELLGAIVILGILIGVSVPLIVSLLDTSRNKMYINDAKKLVTQAEYKLKSNSSSIEKPDEGDCIAVSMVYLDSPDFDNPPNEGKYEKENSFVIIKNNGGKLEYSVTIVEKVKKGGYKGVELVRDSALIENDAISHVVSFKKSDLINIETDVNRGYINEKLGEGYISEDNNITAIYNYPDLDDSSSNNDVVGIPRITMASLISTSSKNYNSLDATLQLKVEDKDTPRSSLLIYIGIDSSYDSALNNTPIAYGDNDTFSHNINFSANHGYDGSSAKVYIVVKDPEGNTTKKTMTYKIHKNSVPEIDEDSTITKRNKDVLNMTTGLVRFIVSDDIDDANTLSVCFKESASNEDFTSCDNYAPYSNYFGADNTMEYNFTTCNGACTRDGSTHYLTIFVKDSLGGISNKKFKYVFSTNTAPTINSLTVNAMGEEFTEEHGKTLIIRVNAEDDIDSDDQMTVRVNDGIETKNYNYSGQPIYHTINSNYDGSTKTIKVAVIDSEGAVTEQTRQHTLYQNVAPKINSFTISSAETVCVNQALCPPENGGSKNVNISLNAEDDIDDNSHVSVCLSLDSNSCNDYVSYSNFHNKNYSYTVSGNYDGSTKTIYAYVKDTYGQVTKKSYEYKLYKNQAPVIELATVATKSGLTPVSRNLNTVLNIDASDDFDTAGDLKLQIIEDGVTKVDNANLSDYLGKDVDYTFSGGYDGGTRELQIKVSDSSSLVSTKTVNYTVYKDKAPEVESFEVYSKTIPCKDEIYCPIESSGNYNAAYKLRVSDDLDDKANIQVCVTEGDTCTNYSANSNYYDQDNNLIEFNHTFSVNDSNKPYDGSEKHLKLFVKDSYGNVTTEDFKYNLYENQSPNIIGEVTLVSNAENSEVNIPDATFSVAADDDIDSNIQIQYCYIKGESAARCTDYENYQESKVLDRTFFNVTRPNGDKYKVYAKIKDSYGAETTTDEISYTLINDIDPIILSADLIKAYEIYKNNEGDVVESLDDVADPSSYSLYTRFKIGFSVDDPYDTYSVNFVSSDGEYTGTYQGNSCVHSEDTCIVNQYNAYYDKAGSVNDGDNLQLEMYVKDSYGRKTHETVYDGTYTECEMYDEEDAVYTYRYDDSENPAISMDRCAGKCYRYNSYTGQINDIKAFYEMKISYTDLIHSKTHCSAADSITYNVEQGCDYKDCFYKNNNYTRNAIGTELIDDSDEPWIANVNGNEYTCTGHYDLYLSSYTEGKKNITLTKTNTMICKEAFENHEYDYDSTSNNPYVIVND